MKTINKKVKPMKTYGPMVLV